jgi:hypothetical protein
MDYLAKADVMSDFGVMVKTAMVLYVVDTCPRSKSRAKERIAETVKQVEGSTEGYIEIAANRVA